MADIKPSIALLKKIGLFKSFTDSELNQILAMGQTKAYPAYSNIVIEGETSWGLYLILSGAVGIYKTNRMSGNMYDVGRMGSGQFFGEMSLIDDQPRSATVRSLDDCVCFSLPKDRFQKFLAASQNAKLRFYENCIQSLVSRLRELDENYVVTQYQLWKFAFSNRKEAS